MSIFTKLLGLLLISVSLLSAVFYIFWFFGYLPIDPELAVKLPVLVMVLALCFIVAWLGYVMATAPIRRGRREREESL